MDSREGAVASNADPPVVPAGPGWDAAADRADAPPPRRGLAIGLILALTVAVLTTLGLLWVSGGQEATVTTAGPGGSGAPAPARTPGLTMDVNAPTEVLAGQPAAFTLSWSDDQGTFSGTVEEWGDGVGAGSMTQEKCGPGVGSGPAQGDLVVRHTWAQPGTYTVRLGVVTSTCSRGSAATEEVTDTLTVEVLAAP